MSAYLVICRIVDRDDLVYALHLSSLFCDALNIPPSHESGNWSSQLLCSRHRAQRARVQLPIIQLQHRQGR